MEFARDIPFDSPENSAKNIILIVQEEANQIGAKLSQDLKLSSDGIFVQITIDVENDQGTFRLFLSYAEERNLQLTGGRIGTGFITASEFYDLELMPDHWKKLSPPFYWMVSPQEPSALATHSSPQPTFRLDGSRLRQMLRQSLSSPPQQLP
jgi:hypothetical protein